MGGRYLESSVRARIVPVVVALTCALVASVLSIPSASGVVAGCSGFSSQAKAQASFLANGGPVADDAGLDPDSNGIACDEAPAPYRGILQIGLAGEAIGGRYVAPNNGCSTGRSVAVYKLRKGKPPKRLGIDPLDGFGAYEVPTTETKGRFVARIAKAGPCAAESSPVLTLPDGRRLEIAPGGLFFRDDDETQTVEATFVDDATGSRTPAWNVWFRSTRPENFTVDRSGDVTSHVKDGSSQIIATAAGVTSSPVLAVAASLPDDARTLTDDQIEREPFRKDPDAESSVDELFLASLVDIDPAPEAGQLFVSTQTKGLAGRVEKVSDLGGGRYEVAFSNVGIGDVLPRLTIDESFDVGKAPMTIDPGLAEDYDISRNGTTHTFTRTGASPSSRSQAATVAGEDDDGPCELEADKAALVKFESFDLGVNINPSFDLKAEEGRLERLTVKTDPVATFAVAFTVQQAFEFEIECEFKLFEPRQPFPGLVGLLLGAQAPVSIVVTAAGKLTLASANVEATTAVRGHAEIGVACPPRSGQCDLVDNVTMSNPVSEVKTTTQDPLTDGLRFEPELTGVLRVAPSLGFHHDEDLRLVIAHADLGAKIAGRFGTVKDQLNHEDFASEYDAAVAGGLTIGPQLEDVAKKLNIEGIEGVSFELPDYHLAESPSGILKADKDLFRRLAKVNFDLRLFSTDFFGFYNVKQVLLIRRATPTSEPEVVKEITPFPGQRRFDFSSTANDAGYAGQYYAFVITEMAPTDDFRMEIDQAEGPFSCGAGRRC